MILMMNNRERTLALLHYQPYDRLPVVHFGYWNELLDKWAAEGHLTPQESAGWSDGNEIDAALSQRLGFDFNWYQIFGWQYRLYPPLKKRVIEERPDGERLVLNEDGGLVIEKAGIVSIPREIDHLLKDRRSWEGFFLPRLQFDLRRITETRVTINGASQPFEQGGREMLLGQREHPYGLGCGSLLGVVRDWVGLVNMSYMLKDDPLLLDEIIEVTAELCYQGVRAALESGAQFDFGHFWEDIAYKQGPLFSPKLLREKIGPHYRRITDLLHTHGVDLVSLDCDGKIDTLIPLWLENGVNVMFPMEVGTWDASLAPWRAKYGRALRGVGGLNKHIFGMDRPAIDAEIERLRPLVELGGYIPCPDHRLPIEAEWENVQYYTGQMRQVYG